MSDLIERQAVIDEIEFYQINPQHFSFVNLINDIKEIPSAEPKQGEWISVEDRLPEKYGEYMITWTTSQSKRPFIAICEGEVTGVYDHEHNRFMFEWLLEDYIKAYPDVKVTAWQELPEPYKGDKEQKE